MMKKKRPQNDRPTFDAWIDRSMFVRFPPAFIERALDQPLPVVDLLTELRGSPAQHEASLSILGSLGLFTEYQDPIALMEAFSAAVAAGVYPPIVVLQAIEEAFTRYREGKGALSLNQAFHGTTRGTWSPFTKHKTRIMTRFVATLLYKVKLACHLSREKAAERVQLALEHHHHLGLSYSAETLSRKYPTWKKQFLLDERDISFYDHPDNPLMPWTTEHRARFLAAPDFPLF